MEYGFKLTDLESYVECPAVQGSNEGFLGTITLNNKYLMKDGTPWIPVMGEYHFQRDKKENWKTELLKMRAGGVGIVATYIFWIYVEEEEGKWNFEGDNDLRAFLEVAKEISMPVLLRVGPWAHGECRNGGFPDWVAALDYARSNDERYMSLVRKLFTKYFEASDGFLYKQGGPIVGMQIENELTDKADHIKALKDLAVEVGFDLPLYTATGWNSKFGARLPKEMFPVFGAYADAPWDGRVAELPLSPHYAFHKERNDSSIGVDLLKNVPSDGWRLPYELYPFATCEIGPGMQTTHHRRVVMTGMDAYAMSLVKLGAGNNLIGYYMYHGGINKIGKLSTFNESKETGYPNDYSAVGYDFGTCLSSYGEIRLQYRLLNLLHLFVNDFGRELAPMQTFDADYFAEENDFDNLRYCIRTDGRAGFIFVNNYQRHHDTKAYSDVRFNINGKVYPGVNVAENDCFILPVNLKLNDLTVSFATAQLLCREGNTVYFMKTEGNEPKFMFDGEAPVTVMDEITLKGITIKVIDRSEALYLRKLSGKVYIDKGKDIYEEDGEIREVISINTLVTVSDATPDKDLKLEMYEMSIGGERKLTWKKLEVNTPEGFVTIDIDDYDVAQIYADGILVADYINEFVGWRVPANLIYGKKTYLVMSELRDDFYINKEDVKKVRMER